MIRAAADGSALGNPGPAGWAWYINDDAWASGGWSHATNNQGELEAVRQLLIATEDIDDDLHIYCDSSYVVRSMTQWVHNWRKKGWRKSDGSPVQNLDLIRPLDELITRRRNSGRNVTFEWVRGHNGHELNEKADSLAFAAARAFQQGQPHNPGPGFGVTAANGEADGTATAPAPTSTPAPAATPTPTTPTAEPTLDALFTLEDLAPTMGDMTADSSTNPSASNPTEASTPAEPTLPTLEPRPTHRSSVLFEQAQELIPGGVNSPVRAFKSVGGHPVFMKSGRGSHLIDVDGNTYVDLVCSWGPMIHGHAHPQVVEAVQRAAANGLSFGTPTEAETLLAREIINRTSVEEVRMVNSGTEATMSAVRLARAYTGRTTIVKFAGCYHGHVDSLLVQAGSGVATFAVPDCPGVSQHTETVVLPYNDIEAVRQVFADHSVAAIITEAAVGNMGTVAPTQDFNKQLAELCHRNGALLILDEVMTGFRVDYKGWFGIDGVIGDLVTFGKVVSGGLPAAAFGGRREIMDHLAPNGPVYQAGTLSGNPVAMAAGLASLQLATPETYDILRRNADRLSSLISTALTREGVAHHIQRAGTFLSIRFAEGEGLNFTDMSAADTWRYPAFFHALLQAGVYAPPSVYETWFVSTALTDDDFATIERGLAYAARAAAQATAPKS